jgi:hypothetical protein
MKYLKISNQGMLDVRLIMLMGASTKTDDPTKIGQFGTGLKYAIAYFLRNDIDFKLFVGEEEIEFSVTDENISGKEFKEIYCDGKSMNITTQYGYQWNAWEAIREIYCNAMDEEEDSKTVIDGRAIIKGVSGKTTFYIGVTDAIKEVLDKWDDYFFKGESLFENEKVAIYRNTGTDLKLYKNGILIQSSGYYKSLFLYDLKQANLNELRQYQGYLSGDIAEALLSSCKEVISLLLAAIADKAKTDLYEVKLDWSYKTYDAKTVKSIFSGWLFLHPSSTVENKGKSLIVNESLFMLLKDAGVPTERLKKSSGGYYGGSGGYTEKGDITYKEVLNPELQQRIQAIAVKYGSGIKYSIAVPKTGDFELFVNNNSVIFNSSLENLSNDDLEATVLIGIFHAQDHNFFKAFKRLIRFVMGNRNFKKILFGRNIGSGIKPQYEAPSMDVPKPQVDDLLPF